MIRYLPTPRQALKALNATGSMMLMKFTMMSTKSAIIFICAVIFAVVAIISASYCGQLIREIATIPSDIAAKQMALNYLSSYSRGEMGTLGSVAFGMAIYSSLLAPFTGVISNSLISPKNVSYLQAPLLTRYTDSFVSQMFSSISLFQLFTLTTMGSLITLGTSQAWAMLYVWFSWPILISISVIASWAYEALQRVASARNVVIIVSTIVVIFGGFALYNVNSIGTFFGLGTFYTDVIKEIGHSTATERAFDFIGLGVAFLLCCLVGSVLSLYALSKEERTFFTKKEKVPFLAKLKHSEVYEVEMLVTMMKQVLRNPDSIRPIVVLIILGVPASFIFRHEQVVQMTFLVTIPLIMACSWGINFLGVLGGGLALLRNQPRALDPLPWIAAVNQVIFTLALFSCLWVPAFAFGAVPLEKLPAFGMAAIATTVLVTRSSLSKAINAPHATHPGTRGETLVPMGTMIGYTLRMSLWGCQYGIILLSSENLRVQVGMCVAAVLWSLFRMYRLARKWQKPETQFAAIQALSQA